MAFIDQFNLASDVTFKSKVQIACVRGANTILANNTANLIPLARQVLRDPVAFAVLAAQIIQSDATVAAAAPTGSTLTDAQIQTAVNTLLPNLLT